MGKRGPAPLPTAIKKLRGNPGKRKLNQNEPSPRKVAPVCPKWISKDAKNTWRRAVRELKGMGVLTTADGDALTAYCQVFGRWKEAEEFLKEHGSVYPIRDETGNIRYMQQFPQVSIARTLLLVLKAYQQEFGLTPSSRSTISLEPRDAEEDSEEATALRLIGA